MSPSRKSAPPPEDCHDAEDCWARFAKSVKPLPDRLHYTATRFTVGGKPAAPVSENQKIGASRPAGAQKRPFPPHLPHKHPIRDIFWQKQLKKQAKQTLDLHGYTQQEARRALEEFLYSCWEKDQRCCLIIVGRGRHSPLLEGVLQRLVPILLEQNPLVYQFGFSASNQGSLEIILRKKTTP